METSIITLAILSRIHGSDNRIPKALESLAYGVVSAFAFKLTQDYTIPLWVFLLSIVIVALGKSMGHRDALLMIKYHKITLAGLWAFARKSTAMTVPFFVIALFNEDFNKAWILSLALFHMHIAYFIGYAMRRWIRLNVTPSVIGEILTGAFWGLLLTI